MQKKIQAFMEQFHMLLPEETVAVGLSGGADSVCLLLMLHALRNTQRINIVAIHVEHGIRGEKSLEDLAFSKALCEQLGVALECVSVDVPSFAKEQGISLEEAARKLRYRCFFDICKKYGIKKLAVAHHANDQAETILFHLARGSAISGMAGMRPVSSRAMDAAPAQANNKIAQKSATADNSRQSSASDEISRNDKLIIIRPLLCVTRAEIEAWLQEQKQDFCIDETNADVSYARNRLRHHVLPELAQINSEAIRHIGQTGRQVWELEDFLEEELRKQTADVWCKRVLSNSTEQVKNEATTSSAAQPQEVSAPACSDPFEILIHPDRFLQLHPFLQKQLLHRLLATQAGQAKDLTAVHVEQLAALMKAEVGKQVHLPYGIIARKDYEEVVLESAKQVNAKQTSAKLRNAKQASTKQANTKQANAKQANATPSLSPQEELPLAIPGETKLANGMLIRTRLLAAGDLPPAAGNLPTATSNLPPATGNLPTAAGDFSGEIPQKRYTKWFDYDKMKFTVQLRGRKKDDFFQCNAAGGHKSLNRFFIDEKIPRHKREEICLLADGDHILWIIGYRISEAYKVTAATKRILQVEVTVPTKEDYEA